MLVCLSFSQMFALVHKSSVCMIGVGLSLIFIPTSCAQVVHFETHVETSIVITNVNAVIRRGYIIKFLLNNEILSI